MKPMMALLCMFIVGISLPAISQAHGQEPSEQAVTAQEFRFKDGGESIYYSFRTGNGSTPDTYVFIYGTGSGCYSWRTYLPGYFKGLEANAMVFAINKRHVPGQGITTQECGPTFDRDNNPRQWVSDDMEFVTAQLAAAASRPRNVVMFGVSEGAYVAARVARSRMDVTHLVVIGDGAWSMRESLHELIDRKSVEAAWMDIAADMHSLDKKWLGNPYRWWYDVMDLSAAPDYLALNIPILVGFGENDESVSVNSALSLRARFNAAGKDNLMLRIYPGADHTLSTKQKAYRPEFFHEVSRVLATGPQ